MSDRFVLWHRRIPVPHDGFAGDFGVAEDPPWTDRVSAALLEAGAEMVARIGGSIAVEVAGADLDAAIECALGLISLGEQQTPQALVCFGVSREAPGADHSAAFDLAQLLANRARPGELLLDPEARGVAATSYLFGRTVNIGVGAVSGFAIDRDYPRRDACRRAIEYLSPPPIPSTAEPALERIRELAQTRGQHRLILRGTVRRGLSEFVGVLAEELRPPLVLKLEAVPGALEPLGSLRYALTHRWKTREGVQAAVAPLSGGAPATLGRIAKGIAVDRSDAVQAVTAMLAAHSSEGSVPWIIADPLSQVDPATIGVISEAMAPGGTEALLLGRLRDDVKPPTQLLAHGDIEDLPLPRIRSAGALEVARVVLGEKTDEGVCQRVAQLGGASALGVVEAARVLVAGGDLIHGDESYRWRAGPRSGVRTIPIEALIEERVTATDGTARCILEAICATPSGSPSELSRTVAMADGIGMDDLAEGIERLCGEAFLAPEEPLYATSAVLRTVVVHAMTQRRLREVYGFIAGAMEANAARDAEFEKATIGYYLAEGGQEAEGARALIEAGRAAGLRGFPRAAVRLAAAAVRYDPSPRTRNAATILSRSVSSRRRANGPPVPDTVLAAAEELNAVGEEEPESVGQSAIRSLRERDFDSVDRLLDIAIAEGVDPSAADRLRALTELGRGELGRALVALHQARAAMPDDDQARTRTEIARGIILLGSRKPALAVRCALRALRFSRSTGTETGEAASLKLLSLCFSALGRDEEARAIASG
ncbi:MAG: hypothetical protein JRH11_08385 [Deltaproteobacteria bacterium]|nr:hypothetical protein [Deltaproteobacteria bacterium]